MVVLRDKEAFRQLLTAVVSRCNQLLSEENLQLAGILSSSDMRAPTDVLMRAVKKKWRATYKEGGSRKKRACPQSPAPTSDDQQAGEGVAPLVSPPAVPSTALLTALPIDLTADMPSEEPRAVVVHPSVGSATLGTEPINPATAPAPEEGSSASGGVLVATEVVTEDAMTGEGRGGMPLATGATSEPQPRPVPLGGGGPRRPHPGRLSHTMATWWSGC